MGLALVNWRTIHHEMRSCERTDLCTDTTELPTEIHAGYSRPLGSGVVGTVASTEKPILLDDVRTFPGFIETMPGTKSELCVPVRHGGKVVAILNLESIRTGAFHDQVPL